MSGDGKTPRQEADAAMRMLALVIIYVVFVVSAVAIVLAWVLL